MITNDLINVEHFGIIYTNNGTVTTNNGGIVENNGTVSTNNGELIDNKGTVTINELFVGGNESGGTVETNNKSIGSNFGTVKTNNDYVDCNKKDGTIVTNNKTVETNDGTIRINNGFVDYNHGIVETNTLTGTTDLSSGGTVTNNYGTVWYAKVDEAGNIVYDATSKLYGVTYGETPESLSVFKNEQVAEVIAPSAETTNYTVLTAEDANASKSGYKFINWVLRTATAEDLAKYTATTYVGGEQITVVSPIWLEAVWEKLPEAVKRSAFTSLPTSQGSSSAPLTSGGWSGTDGKWSYVINGQKLINCTAWIQYTDASGEVVTGKFCFDNNGYALVNSWKEVQSGVWNYFGADGKMVTNTTTPDGYVVDASGEWRK